MVKQTLLQKKEKRRYREKKRKKLKKCNFLFWRRNNFCNAAALDIPFSRSVFLFGSIESEWSFRAIIATVCWPKTIPDEFAEWRIDKKCLNILALAPSSLVKTLVSRFPISWKENRLFAIERFPQISRKILIYVSDHFLIDSVWRWSQLIIWNDSSN